MRATAKITLIGERVLIDLMLVKGRGKMSKFKD